MRTLRQNPVRALRLIVALGFLAVLLAGGPLRADAPDARHAADVLADPTRIADVWADGEEKDPPAGGDAPAGGEDGEDGSPAESPPDVWEGPTTFTAAEVNLAIRKGVSYLRSRQRPDGSWGVLGGGDATYEGERAAGSGYTHPAGPTALALYALLKCKVPPEDAGIRKGFDFLGRAKRDVPRGTYECAALLLAVTATGDPNKSLGASPKARPKLTGEMRAWAQALVQELVEKRAGKAWRYQVKGAPPTASGENDLSSTQLVALALFAADRARLPVDDEVWKGILEYSLAQQDPTGSEHEMADPKTGAPVKRAARGFSYMRGFSIPDFGRPCGSMTACGLANVMMARHVLTRGGDPKRLEAWNRRPDAAKVQQSLYDALAWLDVNWSPFLNPGKTQYDLYHVYWLYAVERAMDLVGLARIGNHLWYSDMGQQLLNQQRLNGSWDTNSTHTPRDVIDTSFALLFLRRATKDIIPFPSITPEASEPMDNR